MGGEQSRQKRRTPRPQNNANSKTKQRKSEDIPNSEHNSTPSQPIKMDSDVRQSDRQRSITIQVDQETSILADLDDMLDHEMESPTENSNGERNSKNDRLRTANIARSASDVTGTQRKNARIVRSSSVEANKEDLDCLSPLGRIPEKDYPILPRAKSANPLPPPKKSTKTSQKKPTWTKMAYRRPSWNSEFNSQLEGKIKVGLEKDFLGYHLQQSGFGMYRSRDSIEDKLMKYRSHNELNDLERELNSNNKLFQSDYAIPHAVNNYASYETSMYQNSKENIRYKNNITFKEIETHKTQNIHGTSYRELNGTSFMASPRARRNYVAKF